MAKPYLLLISFVFLLSSSFITAQPTNQFSRNVPPSSLGLNKENLTHLHFFFHDIVGGPNATAVRVAEAPITNSSASVFGAVAVFDNLLTVGSEANSTVVGRGQGMYTFASQSEMAVLLMVNFAFTERRYNGSTITVMGRNVLLSNLRELPIVGGTGIFRFARGYVEARPFWFDPISGDAIVEYDIYVLHY